MGPLVVVGSLSLDLVDSRPPRIGGAVYYAARALKALGGPRAVLITKSAPEHRRKLLAQLAAFGLPVRWHPASTTTTFAIGYEGETRRMSVESPGDPWTPDELEGAPFERAGWIHVGALLRPDFPASTLAILARGRRLLLDGQALVRPGRRGPLRLDRDFDPSVLEHVHVLKLSEDEARVVLDDLSEQELGRLGVPEVIVTLGSQGSIVFASGRAHQIESQPVNGIDPTGAGDSFAAAYLAGRSSGHPPIPAARRATALVVGLLAGRLH